MLSIKDRRFIQQDFINELMLKHSEIMKRADIKELTEWIKVLKTLLQEYSGLILDIEARMGELFSLIEDSQLNLFQAVHG